LEGCVRRVYILSGLLPRKPSDGIGPMKRVLVPLLICPFLAAFAGEIREFDLKRVERLGLELDRVSRRPDRGATNDVRKRARQTGIDAVQGRLYKIHYEFVVVDDPDGTGFLIYAL